MTKQAPEKKRSEPRTTQLITDCGGRYYFDQRAADKAVKFISLLRHTKSPHTGKRFILQPWQKDYIEKLFGWKRVSDKARRFTQSFLEIPKKNGKSALCSAISLYLLMADGEYGAEVYCVANERGQARIVFDESKSQIRLSKELKRHIDPNPIKPSTKILRFPATSSFYTTLSSQSSTKDGMNIHGLVFDELHALKDPSLFHTLTQGSGAARRQPLHVFITTAGTDRNSICRTTYEHAKAVIQDETVDEQMLAVIYEADPKDDWTKPETWHKANPSLGITISEDKLKHDCEQAQKQPSLQNEFKRLRLNIWTSQVTRWLNMSDWQKQARQYDISDFRGLSFYGGVDLSSTLDLTALSFAFPKEEGVYLWPFIFMPEERVIEAEKRDRVPYSRWVDDGFITLCPGRTNEIETILRVLEENMSAYNLDCQSISFDPWQAASFSTAIEKRNIKGIAVTQNYSGMSPPCKETERLILSNRLFHPDNPVLNWAADNIEVRTGPNGVIAPHKPAEKAGQQKRIDPMVASILSLERVARGVEIKERAYETHGIRFL